MKSSIAVGLFALSMSFLFTSCGPVESPEEKPQGKPRAPRTRASAPQSPTVNIPSPVNTGAPQKVCVLNAGALSEATLKEITDYLADEFALPVASESTKPLKGEDPASYALAASGERPNDMAFLVAFVDSDKPAVKHLHAFKDAQLSIVNVQPMKTDDKKLYELRLKRQAIRGIAFAAGMKETLDPFCVLRRYNRVEDIDKMGLNFFPPAADRFEKAMRASGVKLTRESVWKRPPLPSPSP